MLSPMRDFHVRREARDRYGIARPLIGSQGDLVAADLPGIRRLASRMNETRLGGPAVHAGEIGALGLIHEIGHLLIARYEAERRPGAIAAALAAGLDQTFSRPERIRPWTYDFDPSGLELLRRAIEHVAASRPVEAAVG